MEAEMFGGKPWEIISSRRDEDMKTVFNEFHAQVLKDFGIDLKPGTSIDVQDARDVVQTHILTGTVKRDVSYGVKEPDITFSTKTTENGVVKGSSLSGQQLRSGLSYMFNK